MRAGVVVAALAGAAMVLSGCQYLFRDGPMFPLPSDGPYPSPATYSTGSATITIGSTTTLLDHLVGPASTMDGLGTEALWTDGDGFYLRYFGSSLPDDLSFMSLDRIHDGTHWTTSDPTGCSVTVTQADKLGLAGTATCKGLRWTDAMAGFGELEPQVVGGEPPFDAQITFKAAP